MASASRKRDREIRISKDKHFIALACVPLDALSFPYSRDLDTENVERLRNEFRGNCFSEKEEHHIPAIISMEDYDKGTLLLRDSEKPLWDPPTGMKLRCLHGKHRVKAAEGLRSKPDRWLVAMYNATIEEIAQTDLMDGYDNSHKPCDDGKYYYNIKYHQRRNDIVLAQWWRARLKTSDGDAMHQLAACHGSYDNQLDSLHVIDALYAGFRFGSLKRLWRQRCPDELRDNALGQVRQFFYETVFGGDTSAMKRFDTLSLKHLEFTAPGACKEDNRKLSGKFSTGEVFSGFNEQQRRQYFNKICEATRRMQVPSLKYFFRNLTYFETLRNCMMRLLVPPGKSETEYYESKKRRSWNEEDKATRSLFANAFVHRGGQCLVQIDDYTLVRVHVEDRDKAFDIAYRQLWLFAIRNQGELPPCPIRKTVGPTGDPANKVVLYEFALLAQKLGFMNATIRALLDPLHHPDRAVVKHMLESTRKGYRYHDIEKAISVCLDQVNSAVPAPVDIETDECALEDKQKVKLFGRPLIEHAKADRRLLYLHKVHETSEHHSTEFISSYFVARSQYFSWFGDSLGLELNITDDLPRVALRDSIASPIASERLRRPAEEDDQRAEPQPVDASTIPDDADIFADSDDDDYLAENVRVNQPQSDSELKLKNKALGEENDALRAKNGALEEEINELRDKNSALEEEKSELREKNGALEEDDDALRRERGALREEDNKLRNKNTALEEENDALRRELGALKEQKSELQEKNGALEEEINELREKNSALEEENNALRRELGALEEENNELEQTTTRLEVMIEGLEDDLERLTPGGLLPELPDIPDGHSPSTRKDSIKIVFWKLGSGNDQYLPLGPGFQTKGEAELFAAHLQRGRNRLYILDGDETPCELVAPENLRAEMLPQSLDIFVVPDNEPVSNMPSAQRHSAATMHDLMAKRARRQRRRFAAEARIFARNQKPTKWGNLVEPSASDGSGRVEINSKKTQRRRDEEKVRGRLKKQKTGHLGPGGKKQNTDHPGPGPFSEEEEEL
ncbi:transposase-like protein [Purpureocillium lavendulum]|uniref:Transposase-like protein n=1 Tax=Purpureocillium lavendulum TaxID=1247861 RepID=A0AB34FCX2_9HYPO|nr:transposase-like protein [Purpureocillium lavendulum]